jgi:hypothetical protein
MENSNKLKAIRRIAGIIVIAMIIIGFSFTACDSGGGSGGGNKTPEPIAKSLSITGLDSATLLDKSRVIVALIEELDPTLVIPIASVNSKAGSITFKLVENETNSPGTFNFDLETSPAWTGSGSYYVVLFPSEGNLFYDPVYHTSAKINFGASEATTIIAFSQFEVTAIP